VFVPLGLGMIWLNIAEGRSDRLPVTIAYITSLIAMFTLPIFLVMRHRSRQQNTLARIRGLYALACEMLDEDRKADASRLLRSIRRWERHWKIGESALYRLAYSWFVMTATAVVALMHQLLYVNVYSQTGYDQTPQKNLLETFQYLQAHPLQFLVAGIIALVVGVTSQRHLHDLKGAPWSAFYGDVLESAIKAGRGVNEAPQHRGRELPLNASARELLGLPPRFTAAELRRAWLRLARELHPDRWAAAGEGVRRMKEAALKRVNAARDELAPQAVG
jgi:hypothetical protein